MAINRATIQNALSGASQVALEFIKAAGSAIQSTNIPHYAQKAYGAVALRVQEVWAHLLPLVNGISAFVKKDIGIATVSILAAAGVATASRNTKNSLLSGAFFVGSLCCAVLGGIYLSRSGVLPPFFRATAL